MDWVLEWALDVRVNKTSYGMDSSTDLFCSIMPDTSLSRYQGATLSLAVGMNRTKAWKSGLGSKHGKIFCIQHFKLRLLLRDSALAICASLTSFPTSSF
jgi:hypothetical protein